MCVYMPPPECCDGGIYIAPPSQRGTRYSLILFFYALSDDPDSLAYQSVARSELYATGRPEDPAVAKGPSALLNEAAGGLLRRVGAGSSSGSQWSFVDDP